MEEANGGIDVRNWHLTGAGQTPGEDTILFVEDGIERRPLLKDGKIVSERDFNGYFVTQFLNLRGFFLLELKQTFSEIYGIWIFDENLTFITSDLFALGDDYRRQIDNTLRERANTLWRALPGALAGNGLDWSFDFGKLCLETRSRLLYSPCRLRQSHTIVLNFSDEVSDVQIGAGANTIFLKAERINQFTGKSPRDFQNALIADGILTIASPITEKTLHSQTSIVLSDFHFVYPFMDGETLFFTLCWEHYFRPVGLYFPVQGVVLSFKNDVTEHHLRCIEDEILNHFATYRDRIEPYLTALNTRTNAVAIRDSHLGHHLWNELTGLDRLAQNPLNERIKTIVVYGAENTEMYGSVEELFPNFASRVVRLRDNNPAFIEFAYEHKLFLFRISDHHISERLATKVIERGRRPRFTDDPSTHLPCVVFGLRVECRTWVNQIEGIVFAIEHLLTRVRKFRVIIDGHNGLKSYGLTHSTAEARVAEQLVDRSVRGYFAQDERIVFENGLGLPLVDALAQISKADFFVAPWGAGLAKYKWVCNLPGVILTGKSLSSESEITNRIYERTIFRESASECTYVDPVYVVDLPDYPLLIDRFEPRLQNFYVHKFGLIRAIDAELDRINSPKWSKAIKSAN